jgi:glycosyltransferase involved in cell wall biosynthesis
MLEICPENDKNSRGSYKLRYNPGKAMDITHHKRRVAHVITQLELGGAQRNTLYTLGHLNSEHFEPLLICGPGGMLDEEANASSWTTHYVRWLARPVNPIKDLLAFVALYRLLREIKPHIIHTHSSKAGILGRVAAYIAGVPVIVHTFHGFGFTPTQSGFVRRSYTLLEKFCALLSTQLIFVSKDNDEEARALGIIGSKPHSVIRSGITIQRSSVPSSIREELGIPSQAWMVTSVGNFKPQKNPLDLAKTAKAVLSQDPSVHFLLVGDGELRRVVERYIAAEGLTQNLHLLGWRQDVPMILAASNAFLLTSLWEGLPRAMVEAAMAGVPTVAYAVNGVKDILVEGETGFPVAAHDTAAAAQKLLWIKDHPQEAKRFAQNARGLVEKAFNIDKMVREQEDLYQKLYEAVPLKNYYEPLWTLPSKTEE